VDVLLVDDDSGFLHDLSAALSQRGDKYKVRTARHGETAFEMIHSQGISLLICCWQLPGMSGPELCRKIRNSQFSHYVYCILYSRHRDKRLLVAGMEAGADDFLMQPIDPEELLARLLAAERVLKLERTLKIGNFSLDWLHKQLEEAHETMRRDLARAAAIQKSLLPNPIAWPMYNVDWLFIPCSFLAGDMLGYFPVRETRLAFYLFDVCGHGISSALISFSITKLLRQDWNGEKFPVACSLESSDEEDVGFPAPGRVVEALNRQYCKDPESASLFLTIVYGIFDPCSGQVRLCAAGHPPPLLWRRAERTLVESSARGLPVGIVENTAYEEEILRMEPGDRLFVFSDGITECPGCTGELYGDDRFREALRATADVPVAEATRQISAHLKNWHGGENYPDDISLLILES